MSSNMAALATRIQDRANQFLNEQGKLTNLQTELEQLKALEEMHVVQNQNLRLELLETTRGRHGMELEILHAEKNCRALETEIQTFQEETKEMEKKTLEVEQKFDNDIENLYAPHLAQIELYQQVMDTNRQETMDQKSRKRQRQEQVQARILQLKEEILDFDEKAQDLSEQMKTLKQEELQGNAKVTSLASEVQQALAEVSKK